MDLDFKQHIPTDFAPSSRVWIYQANRLLRIHEALELEELLASFIPSWNSHGTPVKGYANLFFGKFLVFMADESATGVSGCSTDSSVAVVKKAAQAFGVDFFDRQQLNFIVKDKIEPIPLTQFSYAFENGLLDKDTLYFNNIVLTKEAWERDWIIPVSQSWLANRMPAI